MGHQSLGAEAPRLRLRVQELQAAAAGAARGHKEGQGGLDGRSGRREQLRRSGRGSCQYGSGRVGRGHHLSPRIVDPVRDAIRQHLFERLRGRREWLLLLSRVPSHEAQKTQVIVQRRAGHLREAADRHQRPEGLHLLLLCRGREPRLEPHHAKVRKY